MSLNLSTETRKALHDAHRRHKAITIKWPKSQQPIAGHTYQLDKDSDTRIRVEKFYRDGWRALVRLDHDPILSLRLPGTRNENGDYETEPEPVNKTYQERLDAQGRQLTTIQGAERRREERKQRNALRASERTNAPAWLRNLA